MQVHHQKNPQTKKQPHKNPIHAQNPITEPRNAVPRRSNSRSNPQENKSRNECGFITQKIRKQKNQPPQNPIHAQNPHHGAAERSSSAVAQPLHPAGKQVAQRMRVHNSKKSANKKQTPKNSIHAQNPTTEPRIHRILGGRTAAPTRRKTSRATNAGSSPKKSANKKTTSQKSNPRDKSPPRSRGTQFLGGRTAAPTRRKTSRATNASSSPKKSANKKPNLTKIPSTRQIPTTEPRMHRILGGPQPLQPAGKQVAQRMRLPLHSPKQGNLLESSP